MCDIKLYITNTSVTGCSLHYDQHFCGLKLSYHVHFLRPEAIYGVVC
jgi:hypothetical protein